MHKEKSKTLLAVKNTSALDQIRKLLGFPQNTTQYIMEKMQTKETATLAPGPAKISFFKKFFLTK